MIGPGTWEENLVIKKSLILIGAGRDRTKIVGKERGLVILIKSYSQIEVVIEGLTVAEAKEAHGILIAGRATMTIRNSRISGNGVDGIQMWDSSQATISGSVISGNGNDGIDMSHSSQATISDSEISGNHDDGIWMGSSPQATISGSVISGNGRSGILMVGSSSRATIRDNEIFRNGDYGVALYQRPCYDVSWKFHGKVEGSGNKIYNNEEGNVCPSELQFLMTEEGGCYGLLCD